jgi:hypothetical protein
MSGQMLRARESQWSPAGFAKSGLFEWRNINFLIHPVFPSFCHLP